MTSNLVRVTPEPGDRRPATVVVGLIGALCALLLLKWLALVAILALVVVAGVRWAWGRPVVPRPGPSALRRALVPRLAPAAGGPVRAGDVPGEDCSWCGRPGGHLGRDGERIRPRHAHAFR